MTKKTAVARRVKSDPVTRKTPRRRRRSAARAPGPTKKTIRVTFVDIVAGSQRSPFWCPIALVLRRVCGEPIEVREGGWRRSGAAWIRLPARVVRWLERFDRGEPVKPLSFAVEARKARRSPNRYVPASAPAPFTQFLVGLLQPGRRAAIAALAASWDAKPEGR